MAFGRRLFKLPKPKRHEYKPRFYDAKKEELEKRINRFERLKNNDPEAIKEGITGAFNRNVRGGGGNYFGAVKMRQRETRRSNFILLALIIILTALCYMVLNVYLPALG